MFLKKCSVASVILLLAISFSAKAQPEEKHIIVAPNCLIKTLGANYKTFSATHDLMLIETNDEGMRQLISAKTHQTMPCGGFMNVTSAWKQLQAKGTPTLKQKNDFLQQYVMPAQLSAAIPSQYKIQYPDQVNQLIKSINPQAMWATLTTLSNFENRYANAENGVKAATWIKNQIETLAKNNNRQDVTVTLIDTDRYKQPSVIAKVGNSLEAGIVVGAHMDTLYGRKPGADDDGSGTVTVLETVRTLFENGMQFKKPIYFMWYAAEEEGLIGSQKVVSNFKRKKIPIDAVIHFDMTGYAYKNDPTMWLISDYVNKDLTDYLEKLINTYVKQPVKYTRCGYACSDHASWTKNGYNASMPFEASFGNDNPYIHSSQDTMDKLSLAHMTDYTKLAIAFVVEMAEPMV